MALILTTSASWTGYTYFFRWAADPGLGTAFDLDEQLAAELTSTKILALDNGEALAVTHPCSHTTNALCRRHPAPAGYPAGTAIPAGAAARLSLLTSETHDPTDSMFLLHRVEGQIVATWLSPIESPRRIDFVAHRAAVVASNSAAACDRYLPLWSKRLPIL